MENLENRLVARYFPLSYYLAMSGISFRDRVLAAMKSQNANRADLSLRSQVPYHTLDKFLKRDNATTSAENAKAVADALGIKHQYNFLSYVQYGEFCLFSAILTVSKIFLDFFLTLGLRLDNGLVSILSYPIGNGGQHENHHGTATEVC